jgi:hypothetical protein
MSPRASSVREGGYVRAVALPPAIRNAVDDYCRADLAGGLQEHIDFFSFLGDDLLLQVRVGEEYFTARYMYKVFEGLRVGALRSGESWAERAQVQLQVQQYASIYEACIHHLVFVRCASHPAARALLTKSELRRWNIREEVRVRTESLLNSVRTDGRQLVPAVRRRLKVDERRVLFQDKLDAAVKIGIVERSLADELAEFYNARNLIHIHAELRKGASWSWELSLAKSAYRRLRKFRQQVRAWEAAATK